MNENVYEEVAKRYGVTAEEVQREMQSAIEQAFINPNHEILKIPRENTVPTVEEFFEYILKNLK